MLRGAEIGAALCALGFVVVLAVSAYWEPRIRVLHMFEALPYVVAAFLCYSGQKVGYALGVASGAFWLWIGAFLSSFVRNGFERLEMLIRTGSVDRPDILIAAPAAMATGGLMLFSLIAYALHPRKSSRDVLLFIGALVLVAAFFVAIFAMLSPQYLRMFGRLFK